MIARRSGHLGARRGFTLIEAICAIVVIGALGSIVSAMIMRAGATFTGAAVGAQAAADANAAMETIYRRLRSIPAKSGSSPAKPDISSVTSSSIAWGGNTLSFANGTLSYSDDGGPGQTLLTNVTQFLVEPLSNVDATIATPISGSTCESVQRVRVTLTVVRSGQSFTLKTKVFLRSLFAGAAP